MVAHPTPTNLAMLTALHSLLFQECVLALLYWYIHTYIYMYILYIAVYSHDKYRLSSGLVISNIDIDVDIIDDTFDLSISMILSYKSIDRCIDDTLLAFLSTLHRYFSTDMQNDAHNFLSFRAFVRVQRSVEILDERRITNDCTVETIS